MFAVLMIKIRLLLRKPWTFIIMSATLFGFAYMVGLNYETKVEVPVFSSLPQEQLKPILKELNQSETFQFKVEDSKKAKEEVNESKTEMAIQLNKESAAIYISAAGKNDELVKYEIKKAYQSLNKRQNAIKEVNISSPQKADEVDQQLSHLDQEAPFTIEKKGFMAKDSFRYDSRLQAIFGFGLFFVIFTIAYNVVSILIEKNQGVWDRLLLSPLKKWELYAGNLLYSFIVGYAQMALVFCLFRFVLQYNFYGAFGKTLVILVPYTFAIISIALMVAALVKNLKQFEVIISFLAVSMAMIGGAYWPLEIVTSKFLLLLAKMDPVTYGMEALKGATVYGQSWSELLAPIGLLFLIGAVLLGAGIKIIDRK
ncbi:ABC transporter permease [Bacillus testis]|uniref:ABC transporter permease n=1 Tax=Bacillus testis TaxID=1622072 RepID=UPI00067E8F26|nr:ABC transporter permease [Bacillus testis]